MDNEARLAEALRKIHHDFAWFRSTGGSISHHELTGMIALAHKRIEAVRDMLWPTDAETARVALPVGDTPHADHAGDPRHG